MIKVGFDKLIYHRKRRAGTWTWCFFKKNILFQGSIFTGKIHRVCPPASWCWLKSCSTWDASNPVISYLSTAAGFFSISSIDKFQGTIRCEHRMVPWSRRGQGRFFQGGSKTQARLIFQQGIPNYIQTITSLNRSCFSRVSTLIYLFPCILLNSWIIRWPAQIPREIQRPIPETWQKHAIYRRGPSCTAGKNFGSREQFATQVFAEAKIHWSLGSIWSFFWNLMLFSVWKAVHLKKNRSLYFKNFKKTATFLWGGWDISPFLPKQKFFSTIFSPWGKKDQSPSLLLEELWWKNGSILGIWGEWWVYPIPKVVGKMEFSEIP